MCRFNLLFRNETVAATCEAKLRPIHTAECTSAMLSKGGEPVKPAEGLARGFVEHQAVRGSSQTYWLRTNCDETEGIRGEGGAAFYIGKLNVLQLVGGYPLILRLR